MLFTSNYAIAGHHPRSISISLWAPKEFRGRCMKELAPPNSLLFDYKNKKADDIDYTRRFMAHLSTLDPHSIVASIPPLSILLCYEKPTDFCHRHIVAHWIETNTGIVIREITSKNIDEFITIAQRQETI